LVSNLTWGDGCRCCYDPSSDGGEYRALIEAREILQKEKQDEKQLPEEEGEEAAKDDSDDEFDYLLDEDLPCDEGGVIQELEERRRAELEFAILHQEVALQHGYGAHRQMHPVRALRAAGLGGAPSPAVVLHLLDPDSMASASLDLLLETLAEKCRGTKFLRSGGRSVLLMDSEMSQKVLPRLRPDSDMPALVAIREGVVISVCPRLQGLVDEDQVIPEEVRTWLDKAGVLQERPPPFDELCRVRPEEEALYNNMAAAQKNAPPRYDCGIPTCEKTFPHQHVGVQTKQQNGLVVPEEEVVGDIKQLRKIHLV
jgi:hypothetical protein